MDQKAIPEKPFSPVLKFVSLIIVLILNAAFLKRSAFLSFNFFDMGAFLDASWRVFIGQKPYKDFIYITGPLHLYMNAFFFSLFGFGKTAILAHLVSVSSVVIMLSYLIVRKYANNFVLFLILLLTATSFYWPVAHPWYDQSAHLWGLLAVTLALEKIASQKGIYSDRISILIGILVSLSFLTKSNVGAAYGLVFLIFFLVRGGKRHTIIFASSAFLTSLMILVIIGSPLKFIEQTLLLGFGSDEHQVYQQSRRVVYLLAPISWFRNYYWLIGVIVYWLGGKHFKKLKGEFIIFFGILFIGVFCALTGSMVTDANVALWGIACALAFRIMKHIQDATATSRIDSSKIRKGYIVLIALTTGLIFQSALYGFELRVWTYAGNPFGDYAIKSKPLDGWMSNRSEGEDLDSMVAFINQNISQQESLLVLTDMQILYPMTQRDSYRGIPFNFFEGADPAPGKQVEGVRMNIINNPPDWLITNRAKASFVTFLVHYLKLRDWVIENYEPVKKWNHYAILRRKRR